MAVPLRIAVLSDLHIWRRGQRSSWALAGRTFDAVVQAKPDHVIIVGDLFDCASAQMEDGDVVRRRLVRAGLWHKDRLSIVSGNHDIFHTPHRGSALQRLAEFALATTADANDNYEAFCDWAGDLVGGEQRLNDGPFPFHKDLGNAVLLGADTTSVDTNRSANGYWRSADATALRRVATGSARALLAVHHPPVEDPERPLLLQELHGPALGFPPKDFARLVRFADSFPLDAIICGHVHDNGGAPWTWRVGKRTSAFLMGRSGGVDCIPRLGLLTVPRRGPLRWSTRRIG